MTDSAAIRATYSDWRPVKSRKVLQLVMEVPIEQTEQVLTILGAPMPDREMWVAIARLADVRPDAKQPPHPLVQAAGILANEPRFQVWVAERTGVPCDNAEDAAKYIRGYCGISSRRELADDGIAQNFFRLLRADYDQWCRE
jgi:hypothetical protein